MLTNRQIEQVRAAARRGSRLMDRKGPERWAFRVNPDKLRMQSTSLCVLGQSMGPHAVGLSYLAYASKLATLGVNLENQAYYGFSLYVPVAVDAELWAALADGWRDEIRSRTTVPTTPVPVAERRSLVLV